MGRCADSFLVSLQRLLSTVIHSLIKHDHKDNKYAPVGLDYNVASQRVTDLIRYGPYYVRDQTYFAILLTLRRSF